MSPEIKKVLVVDDEEFNLDILVKELGAAGYHTVTAVNGLEAWEILEKRENIFDAILLDRMMPVMDGMAFEKKIKASWDYRHIPVIMQTAASAPEQIAEGIAGGVYYYLTKPFEAKVLLAIVDAAIVHYEQYKNAELRLKRLQEFSTLLDAASFRFSTPEDVYTLSVIISMACPNPQAVVIGLNELLLNAVEHGNLGIGHELKSKLVLSSGLEQEVKRRLSLPENRDKKASVDFLRTPSKILITIKDQGRGFHWQDFIELAPGRATEMSGRGVAMAKALSFKLIEYKGCGNEVVATIELPEASKT